MATRAEHELRKMLIAAHERLATPDERTHEQITAVLKAYDDLVRHEQEAAVRREAQIADLEAKRVAQVADLEARLEHVRRSLPGRLYILARTLVRRLGVDPSTAGSRRREGL